ncbi:MAG: hypothetical protein KIS77_05135 [Saprospiraceae bacterium]|nr:hypothetical protein [Saprospiraceae bacterium]
MSSVKYFHYLDPLASGTVSVSTYAYVLNNPMALVDPNGMSAVGADGLTNEQWIKSSKPGDRNKAGEYKKENRRKEIENAKSNNKKLPDVWYTNDALTTQQLVKAILTATTIWARQGYEKFKFRPVSTSIAKQHKEAYEYQLFIAFTDKTPKDPNRPSPYPPGISTVSPNGRVGVFDKDNERQKGWLSYVNVGHSQIKFHANPSYAAGYIMAHEILHQMIAMANYYQYGAPYEKYWGDVGHTSEGGQNLSFPGGWVNIPNGLLKEGLHPAETIPVSRKNYIDAFFLND